MVGMRDQARMRMRPGESSNTEALVRGGMLLRAAGGYLGALGLGVSMATAGGALSATRAVAAVGAVLAIGLLAYAHSSSRLPLAVLTALAFGMLGGDLEPTWATAQYVGSLLLVLVALPSLLGEIREVLALEGPKDGRLDIDALGRGELLRARRAGRVLTVASVTVTGRITKRNLARVASELRAPLRATDIFGYGGGNRFLVLFVETPEDEAELAWGRLCGSLPDDVSSRLSVGFAAFPDDNPTWEGLVSRAQERAQAATAGAAPRKRERLSVLITN